MELQWNCLTLACIVVVVLVKINLKDHFWHRIQCAMACLLWVSNSITIKFFKEKKKNRNAKIGTKKCTRNHRNGIYVCGCIHLNPFCEEVIWPLIIQYDSYLSWFCIFFTFPIVTLLSYLYPLKCHAGW